MRITSLGTVLVTAFVSTFLVLSPARADGPSCQAIFTTVEQYRAPLRVVAPVAAERALETVQEIKVMTYNVENLFLHVGKFERMSNEEFKRVTDAEIKPEHELEGIAEAISESDPDFIVLEEVEGVEAIQRFSEEHLDNRYVAHLVEGNDERGIQIGFLVKRDLPLDISIESHKETTWVDPTDRKTKKLFSRDAPALMVRRKGEPADATPLLIFIGIHGKSQRDRQGDKGSFILRAAQYKEVGNIVDGYQATFGKDVPIMIGGDFNIDVRRSADVAAVRARMKDAFDLKGMDGDARVTHTFHPRGGRTQNNQLDAIFVTPSLASSVLDVEVFRYKDRNGREKRLPQSWDERSQNPSDHFPITVRISTEKIFPEAFEQQTQKAAGF